MFYHPMTVYAYENVISFKTKDSNLPRFQTFLKHLIEASFVHTWARLPGQGPSPAGWGGPGGGHRSPGGQKG